MSKSSKKRSRQHHPKQTGLQHIPGGIDIPPNQARLIASQISYSGPLPPPIVLKQFDEIVPGSAERIIVMAETQTRHRQALESQTIKSDITKSYLGLGAGLLIALTGFVVGGLLVWQGHDWAGSAFVGTTLVGLVTTFIQGTGSRRREREEKAKIMVGKKSS